MWTPQAAVEHRLAASDNTYVSDAGALHRRVNRPLPVLMCANGSRDSQSRHARDLPPGLADQVDGAATKCRNIIWLAA